MLFPLSSHWSQESVDVDVESQFNTHVSDVALSFYSSATVRPMLAPSRPKPTGVEDSFSPPQVLSESTFSLLSRNYSPSTTDSSCECSETSSVDENFLCGSGSSTMDSTNWEESSEQSIEELSAESSDAEHKSFRLLPVTPDASMIIPLAGVTEQPPSNTLDDLDYEDLTEEFIESVVTGREPAGLVFDSFVTPIGTKDKAETATILPNTTDDPAALSSKVEILSLTQPESVPPVSRRRSSLSSTTHSCSTCHLYAPSSSLNFYLDAWLNQQNDIHPSSVAEDTVKPKKRVSWPDTTSELRNVHVVEKWIEKGLHVHPQPRSRSERMDDSDDSEDESLHSKVKEEEKEAMNGNPKPQVQSSETPLPLTNQTLPTGQNGNAALTVQNKVEKNTPISRSSTVNTPAVQRKPQPNPIKRPSPPSSVSSSSSSSTIPSSVASKQQAVQQTKQHKLGTVIPSPSSVPRVVTQLPAPKKKYSSGVTVKIIGGPYSEHEAAMKIRGSDPIKHRAMIENYWQF